jgi:hypothetical protein
MKGYIGRRRMEVHWLIVEINVKLNIFSFFFDLCVLCAKNVNEMNVHDQFLLLSIKFSKTFPLHMENEDEV